MQSEAYLLVVDNIILCIQAMADESRELHSQEHALGFLFLLLQAATDDKENQASEKTNGH